MNEPVTVRDVMHREYVGVSEADPVSGAATLMRDDGATAAVVLRGREPVGLFTADDLLALVADDGDPGETTVGDATSRPVLSIDADRGLAEAIGLLANRDARRLVVLNDGEVVGLLSEHDIIAAGALLPTAPDEREELPPGPADAEYSTQGLCEVCGSLARDLTERNGQLLCADCLEM